MSGPLEASIKYGKPTETISNLKMLSIGKLTSFGFQLEFGVIGDIQMNESATRRRIAKAINEM